MWQLFLSSRAPFLVRFRFVFEPKSGESKTFLQVFLYISKKCCIFVPVFISKHSDEQIRDISAPVAAD